MLTARMAERPVEVNREQAEKAALAARGVPVPLSIGSADLSWLLVVAPRVPSTPPWVTEDYDIDELKQIPSYSHQ
jgi:hypothetical protein